MLVSNGSSGGQIGHILVGGDGPELAEGPCPSIGIAVRKQNTGANILTIWGRIQLAKVIKFLL